MAYVRDEFCGDWSRHSKARNDSVLRFARPASCFFDGQMLKNAKLTTLSDRSKDNMKSLS